MADPILEIDAAGSNVDGTNPGSALTITTGNYGLLALSSPAPAERVQWASSVDTEGALPAVVGHDNRTVTITLDVTGATALNALTGKIGKLHREGGTLKHTGKNGTVVIADVLATNGYEPNYDLQRLLGDVTTVTFTLPAKPYLRGTESELGTDTVETTLPVIVKTVTGPAGDWYALGRAVLDEDQGADQWVTVWGGEHDAFYTHTTSSGSGALFYEAESRTPLGGASVVSGTGVPSPGGTNNVVRQANLTGTYQAMLSTQATGGGAHLTHVGTFNVWARMMMPSSNTGSVSVAFEYAQGDFRRRTVVGEVTFAANHNREAQWIFQRLGQVTVQKVKQGSHRWEGRIIAKSTVAGDDLDIDFLMFQPTLVSGEAYAAIPPAAPTAFSARDEFDQTAGALTGKTAPVGGTWAGAGSATDGTVDATNHIVTRATNVGDTTTETGRYLVSGVTAFGAQAVQADFKLDGVSTFEYAGALARYVDTSNWFRAIFSATTVLVGKRVSGTVTNFVSGTHGLNLTSGTWYTVRVYVDGSGRWAVWLFPQGSSVTGSPKWTGQDTDLQSGGLLASGKPGMYAYGNTP